MKSAMFLAVLMTLAACTGGDSIEVETTTTVGDAPATTPGVGLPLNPVGENPLTLFAPDDVGDHPVIVLVHGGGWVGGNPSDTAELAGSLGDEAVVFNATYRTLSRGGRYPEMVEDVACATLAASVQATAHTSTPDRVFLVGHSAGAHLAALVAFAPETFTCDGVEADVDGFVGLAGPYDVRRLPILNTLFGQTIEEAPELWAEGNPRTHIPTATDLPVLLIHGLDDEVVPVSFTRELAAELADGGGMVELVELAGIDHRQVRDPAVVGDLILDFVSR